jgi:hypothetical protein
MPRDPAEWLLVFLTVVQLTAVVDLATTWVVGTDFDEIAHYSFIAALAAHPTAFPDWGSYRQLAGDLLTWTDEPNYIAHPPLYHLLMTPFVAVFPGHALPIRLIGGLVSTLGFVLAALGGLSRVTTPVGRIVLVAATFGPPAACAVAGLVNNDPLVELEIGLLIFLSWRERDRPIAVALVLAALGWTKVTGFAAAVLFAGTVHLADLLAGRVRLASTATVARVLGVGLGAVPMLTNLVRIDTPIWVPPAFPGWFESVDPAIAAATSPLGFARIYIEHFGHRFPFYPEAFDATPILIGLFVLGLTALRPAATADARTRLLTIAGLLTTVLYVALHFAYAWKAFRTMGSLAELQPRYLLPVWPMLAAALGIGIGALPGRTPSVVGGLVLVALAVVSGPGITWIIYPFVS